MSQNTGRYKRKLWEGILAGLFLIGLAVLFYTDQFWPWILVLVGITLMGEAIIHYHHHE